MTSTSKKRLDLSSDDEEINENELKINKDFSERYDRYRSKEVLQHLKDKYGDQIWQSDEESDVQEEESDDDSEDDSSELDETEVFDEKFLRVLGALKSKDKTIYDQNSVFYTKDDVVDLDEKKELRKKAKEEQKLDNKTEKMDLMDYHKKLIKEKKGLTYEDEELENEQLQPKTSIGYYEELRTIKQDLLKAAGDDNDNEDADDLIVGKKIIEYIDDNEKKDIKKILETKSKDDKYIKKLDKYWKSDKLNKNEEFLRDFIVNKKYLSDSDDNEEDNNDNNKLNNLVKKEEELSEEEYDSDNSTHRKLVKTYETTRFHHEEPDADKIKRFPRQIESIRDIALKKKKSDKRSEMKERKKQQKEAELKKLRELKRNEIKQKLNLLEKTTGTKLTKKLNELDIDTLVDDTDFDSEKYDKKMSELFNDDYYGIETNDSEKPKFEYDSEIDEEKYYDELDQGLVADDNDYEGEIIKEEGDNLDDHLDDHLDDDDDNDEEQTKKLSKKKRLRLKKKEKLEKKKKDKLASKSKNFGIYEDIIDGQGIRFKYRKTNALNYGLTDEEILLADEKELNRWVSLRKSQQYEDDEDDIEKYDRKGKNLRLKKKILKSIYGSSDDEGNNESNYQNKTDYKFNNNYKESNELNNQDELNDQSNKRKKKNKKRKKNKKQKIDEQSVY